MKRKKYRDWLWILSLSIFAICTLEGIFWYRLISPVTENTFVRLLCYLQNGIKAFKLDPDIKLKDVAAAIPSMEQSWLIAYSYLYCLAVITAPFCTVAALAVLIRKPVYYLKGMGNRNREKKILLIGEGETKEHFAEALPGGECRVYTIEKNVLPEDRQLKYLKRGIRAFVDYEDRETEAVYRQAELEQSDLVLLCDDDPVRNMLNLKGIIKYYEKNPAAPETGKDDSGHQDIYVTCEDEGMKEILSLYYDEYLRQTADRDSIRSFDLFLVDVKERAVRKMFAENPLYTANEQLGTFDVHLGILGFGSFGQQTLVQALNLAVFSRDSVITVDVFDRSIDLRFRQFLRRFSTKILDRVERDVQVNGEKCSYQICLGAEELAGAGEGTDRDRSFSIDGTICLRFWGVDSDSLDYRKKIEICTEGDPFTYFVIALKEDCEMTVSMMEICRSVYGSGSEVRVPIILRTREGSPAAELFTDGRVSTIEQKRDMYSLEALTDNLLVEKAKQFNYRYNQVSSGLPDRITKDQRLLDEEWHKMSSFKRDSSIAQAMHQQVKKWLVSRGLEDREEKEQIEHRRWCVYMILHGYAYGPKRNDILKYHDCISSWENLKKERPDTLEYDYTPYRLLQHE